jgi:protein SCO1/2
MLKKSLKVMNKLAALVLVSFSLYSCNIEQPSLPILGQTTIDENGKEVPHVIPEFSFTNQYNENVTNADFDGKIYVADFFFTSCPTICPVMKSQMLRVYERFNDNEDFKILSHTIDPYHDSVNVLHDYAEALGIKGRQWQFVTGDQDKIYEMGEKAYMVPTAEDTVSAEETGGYIHSGAFILVDRNKHIRGFYDGTVEEEVNKMIRDAEFLLKENE